MKVTAPDIEMPYFKQYYPTLEMLDKDQLRYYNYWVSEFEKGTPRSAESSYIFLYVYGLFSHLREKGNDLGIIDSLKQLAELYPDQVGIHIRSWLFDFYYKNRQFEEAYLVRFTVNHMFRCDNDWLNIKLQTGRDIEPEDVINIAKRYGFVQSALFKKHLDTVYSQIKQKITDEMGQDNILKTISEYPYIVDVEEYLYSGFPHGHDKIKMVDFFSHSLLVEKSLAWSVSASSYIQETYGRKKSTNKPDKQKVRMMRSLWDLKIRNAFKNPHATLVSDLSCRHEYLRLRNHWETYRKYNCTKCSIVFMCECDREIATAMRAYQTEGEWLSNICPKCRGLDDTSIVTEGKLMYGSTFKAIHWREIMVEADWLAYRNNDEIDFPRAENNIREKYGVPLIGEGWISETTLFRNLKSIFPEYEVVHHGKPPWLGRMHLDVYIPDLKIAFEYQGKQHSEPVEYFGGKESFEQVQRRDREKNELCIINGIKLFHIHEGEDFSIETLRILLNEYL